MYYSSLGLVRSTDGAKHHRWSHFIIAVFSLFRVRYAYLIPLNYLFWIPRIFCSQHSLQDDMSLGHPTELQ